MTPKKLERVIVGDAVTVREALTRLNETGLSVLLLVDREGRFRRTVTDGDIRRLLLGGASLETTLAALGPLESKTVPTDVDGVTALAVMNEFAIDELPVLDAEGRPVGLHRRRDLDSQILLSTPHLGDYEMAFVEEAFRTNWVAPLGPNVDAFERELAAYVGVEHAAAVNSGTAALHLALVVLGVGPGDVVFCSTFTFVASTSPILYVGATPVFIDSEPETWNMSPPALGRALADAAARGRLPKAVLVVHLYGQSADMDPIMELCEAYEVPVIEDAAESLGATYKGRASGTIGHLGAYSFNGNKIITTAGGGILVSNDKALIERARFLSTQARDPAPHYEHSVLGYNYRMSNVLAGIGRGQLKVLEDRIVARRAVFERYRQGLAHLPAVGWMPEAPFGRSNRWLTACVIDPSATGLRPPEVVEHLAGARIETRRVWKPMHRQPLFAGCVYYPHEEAASLSDRLFDEGLCLPSGSNMTVDQQQRIIGEVDRLLSTGRAP
jgi:dTDP-4-amino-4,6-dideoxygalactose transaminase